MSGGSVVITGCGVVTAAGAGLAALQSALAMSPQPGAAAPADAELERWIGVKGVRAWTRTARLFAVAARAAAQDAGWLADPAPFPPQSIGIVAGSTFGNLQASVDFDAAARRDGPQYVSPQAFANTVLNQTASRSAAWLGCSGPNVTLCCGETSILEAFDYAAALLRRGPAAALLCGAAHERCAIWDDGARPGQRPSGEGAASFALELETSARRRGARVLAAVSGHGCAFGAAPEAAIEDACRSARLRPDAIGLALLHCASDTRGAAAEDAALLACGVQARVLRLQGTTGDCLEASPAIAAAAALFELKQARHAVVLASDPQGLHAALILSRPS